MERTLLADVLNATERLCILLGSRIHVPDLRYLRSRAEAYQADLLNLIDLVQMFPKQCVHTVSGSYVYV